MTVFRPNGYDGISKGIAPKYLGYEFTTKAPKTLAPAVKAGGSVSERKELSAFLARCAALSVPAPGTGGAEKDSLHSCVCLLEVMADSAKKRGDDIEWSMMSVMAKNGREVLDGYHPE